MNYLIAGGTGFIGKALVQHLAKNSKNTIYLLVRDLEKYQFSQENIKLVLWDSIYNDFSLKLKQIDVVVNLIGENLATGRWSNQRKKELYNSRIDGTKYLLKQIKAQKITVNHYIGASAVGVYGNRGAELLDESASVGDDYLASLCMSWESESQKWKSYCKQYTVLRLGMVLGRDGGAIKRMQPIFARGFGGRLGSGQQYVGWIHIKDLLKLIELSATTNQYNGIINAVSPFQVNNQDFSDCLSKTLRKSSLFDVPGFVLKMAIGEFSSVILGGARVESKKLKESKFHYRFPTIELALKDVVSRA